VKRKRKYEKKQLETRDERRREQYVLEEAVYAKHCRVDQRQ
jgi:hypothetical protein